MVSADEDRCGYRLDIGLDDDELSAEECDRPTWEDEDRCVWHATVDGKSADMLKEVDPEPGDDLDGAYLKEASLVDADWIAGKSLVGAELTAADLNSGDFTETNLMLATLTDVSAINATFDRANLEGAIFTNADLRRASLEGALLDEVIFTDVHIDGRTTFGGISVYDSERTEPQLSRDHPLEAAAWAYRQLQQVYRENALPQLARRSYNQEKDARRRCAWEQGEYSRAAKLEISRWVMGYGSSPYRVLWWSLFVIVLAGVLFPFTGGIQETQGERVITYTLDDPETAPIQWVSEVLYKSLYFSAITFATLGYGDIQPIGAIARMLAAMETIIGSLLSALLVFVLARSVTW